MTAFFKNIWSFLLSLFLIFSCTEDKGILEESLAQNIALEINNSLLFTMSREDSLLVEKIESFISLYNDSQYKVSDDWLFVDTLSVYPYFEFYSNIVESNSIQVLAFSNKEKYKCVKLAFMKDKNIEAIINIPAMLKENEEYILLNYYDLYSRVTPEQFDGNRYFNHSSSPLDQKKIEEMHELNGKLSIFFGFSELKFDYYLFDNAEKLFTALGYDYSPDMFSRYQSNSFCRPADMSIFAGNGSAYHAHELTHLYVHTFVGNGNPNLDNPNSFLDEGFATYFGGSQGFDLKESTEITKQYFRLNNVYFDDVKKFNLLIDEIISFKYVFFGNFIKYLIDFHGPEYALHALKTYKTDDELDLLIDSHRLPDETFNDFVLRIIMSNNFDNE
ncbi:hypothetical protein MM236_05925 [Belliella sp. DSM 107340]|uniref:Peptidase MA-like domain-containing protein n=1 Tax=Belliella calami TaxID=2923436 RepID=A0ABS9UM64_9BACT|nr:hypothetical protein [Belliella calami]MCH7397515.1 hypothetical protein [Belliella calami]